MDVRTTLAFTRPRELARLYSVCGCGLDCIFTHSYQRSLTALCYGCQERLPTYLTQIEMISIAKCVFVGRNTYRISYSS
nr:MAG TPA: protein of unknown function DUF711 [Caudoviricetes sp.]